MTKFQSDFGGIKIISPDEFTFIRGGSNYIVKKMWFYLSREKRLCSRNNGKGVDLEFLTDLSRREGERENAISSPQTCERFFERLKTPEHWGGLNIVSPTEFNFKAYNRINTVKEIWVYHREGSDNQVIFLDEGNTGKINNSNFIGLFNQRVPQGIVK